MPMQAELPIRMTAVESPLLQVVADDAGPHADLLVVAVFAVIAVAVALGFAILVPISSESAALFAPFTS